jgi:hypothetical protein
VRKAARRLIRDGFAVCRIEPGEKRPTYPLWATGHVDPDDIGAGDNIGIVCGPLSAPEGHALVCVDLDSADAVALADEYLPTTGMVEGREGKPRSHRSYLVPLASIPEEYRSTATKTAPVMVEDYGHPGPKSIPFKRRRDGKPAGEIMKLIGTGGQAVVPPSVHDSGERREWEGGRRGAPAVVDFVKLYRAAKKLARKCGWRPEPKPKPAADDAEGTSAAGAPDLTPFLVYRINRYIDALPPAVSGEGGHDACFRAACALVWGFALSEADAIKFLRRFNAGCRPKWSERELLHKVRGAAAATDHAKPRGHLL